MITVAISINGNVVFARSAVNISEETGAGTVCKYKVDDGSIIVHEYDDGAVVLAKKMLDTIKEPKKESKLEM